MAGPLDDLVAVAEADPGPGEALLLPELCDLLFELLVLRSQLGVLAFGQLGQDVQPLPRKAVDLLFDVIQRTHV